LEDGFFGAEAWVNMIRHVGSVWAMIVADLLSLVAIFQLDKAHVVRIT
jgi:hypothetical protein